MIYFTFALYLFICVSEMNKNLLLSKCINNGKIYNLNEKYYKFGDICEICLCIGSQTEKCRNITKC